MGFHGGQKCPVTDGATSGDVGPFFLNINKEKVASASSFDHLQHLPVLLVASTSGSETPEGCADMRHEAVSEGLLRASMDHRLTLTEGPTSAPWGPQGPVVTVRP